MSNLQTVDKLKIGSLIFELSDIIGSSSLYEGIDSYDPDKHYFWLRTATSPCKSFSLIIIGGGEKSTVAIMEGWQSSSSEIILGYFQKYLPLYYRLEIDKTITNVEEHIKNNFLKQDITQSQYATKLLHLRELILCPQLYGDGIHDDTEAIQYRLDNQRTLNLPSGTYLITDILQC